ncbi:C4-dicarboxylate ABC transporter permease [bacterium LRH843]|nr:C4-dicarboxylate ABC transporter permease [bacterium LRH843]
MELFLPALETVFHWNVLVTIVLGVLIGIIIGSLPGLTATMGVALILPVTFSMGPVVGLLLLIGVYFGGVYGGSITAILISTPGTPASAATALDGYAMTKKGLAHKALTISTLSSSIGGMLSVFILIIIAPQLAAFALNFSAPESFALAAFGLSIISSISGESLVKGLIAGVMGLLIATIGLDPINAYARFTFESTNLMGGLSFIPIMIGLFAVSEALKSIETIFSKDQFTSGITKAKLKWKEFKRLIATILRSTGIGTFIGMIPGAGPDVAAFVSYNEAKRFSKEPEQFGKGSHEGVAAPEAANNSCTGGAMIPLLTLGIPGDAVTAVLLGAFLVQGLRPGPLLFENNIEIVYALFVGMIIANLLLMVFGLLGIRLFTKILLVPKVILTPIIIILSVVGSYAIGNNFFDVWVMFVFGVIGYFMQRFGFPASPVVLALILGPMLESNLRRSLVMSHGSFDVFFTRPISCTLLILAMITLFTPIFKSLYKKGWSKG